MGSLINDLQARVRSLEVKIANFEIQVNRLIRAEALYHSPLQPKPLKLIDPQDIFKILEEDKKA